MCLSQASDTALMLIQRLFNPFAPVLLEWTLPSLNLGMSTVAVNPVSNNNNNNNNNNIGVAPITHLTHTHVRNLRKKNIYNKVALI